MSISNNQVFNLLGNIVGRYANRILHEAAVISSIPMLALMCCSISSGSHHAIITGGV